MTRVLTGEKRKKDHGFVDDQVLGMQEEFEFQNQASKKTKKETKELTTIQKKPLRLH